MSIKYIETSKAPEAFGPFSQATKNREWIFTSGAMPLNPADGSLVSGGIAAQTRQTLDNLAAVLSEAGSTLSKVMMVTVYLTDMDEFSEMNAVYNEYFTDNYPARATVGVYALAKNAKVEMQAGALC
jgi:2-iminobutanoate/2-iminopropanoate deaminase